MSRMHELFKIVKVIFKTLLLYWNSSRFYTIILLCVIPAQGIIPAASLWISRDLINQLTLGVRELNPVIYWLFTVWILFAFIQSILRPLEMTFQGLMTDKMVAYINGNLMKKSSDLKGLYYYEDSEFHDDIQVLEQEAAWRPVNLIVFMTGVFRNFITGVAMLIMLSNFRLWVSLLILISILPQAIIVYRLQREAFETMVTRSPEARKMNYYSSIMLSNEYAKEVKLFDLGKYFIEKYQSAFQNIHGDVKRVRYKQLFLSIIFIILGTTGIGFSFWWVLNQTIQGIFTPGDILIFASSILLARESLSGIIEDSSLLYDTVLYMKKYFRFIQLPSDVPIGTKSLSQEIFDSFVIEFKNVDFKYPNEKRYILKDFNFLLHSGEKIALIGENGAGKTTVVKLLTRFYTPTSGSILLNGMDIQNIKIEEYRRLISTVFQDFSKYQLTFKENIILSDLNKEKESIIFKKAIEFAGLEDLVNKLKNGVEQILSKNFDGGTELSGGEWQKISLARSYYRDSPFMIFDEPSSSLDSRSEDKFIKSLSEISKDKTVLLITHRFSALNIVNRVVYIEDGKIKEDGELREVIKQKDSKISQLFNFQAKKYQFDE